MLLGGLGIAMPRYLPIFASKGKVRNVEGLLYASWLYLFVIAFGVSFISNWFGAQIKFTWGSIKVYVRFTSDSNEAQFDFFLFF